GRSCPDSSSASTAAIGRAPREERVSASRSSSTWSSPRGVKSKPVAARGGDCRFAARSPPRSAGSGVDEGECLEAGLQHDLRKRRKEELRPVRLALGHGLADELLQLGRPGGLPRNDHAGGGADGVCEWL